MQQSRTTYRALPTLATAVLIGLGLARSPVSAQGSSEPAISRHADDASLQWGPCPEFMPAGCALTVLHGDPSKANADVFFKVPAGASLPVHWHTSAERMVLISGELQVSFEGQERAVLKAGTYAYGPAGRPHRGACVSSTPCILFIAFEAPVDALPGEHQ
jgi:quercetin dioxygenase-like cupin family protein